MQPWQIQEPIDAIIFDCDSTLSTIEGINVLAEMNGVYAEVCALTEKAMAETGINVDLYEKRLALVNPQHRQMEQVACSYWDHLTLDARAVIAVFLALGKSVYVLSAGIMATVAPFAARLGIRPENVYAVEVYFKADGLYADFDRESPLVMTAGKGQIIEMLYSQHQRIAHIGDGMNDVEAALVADRFVGYGGSRYRQAIEAMSPFYIKCASIAPALPLLLTEEECLVLCEQHKSLYHKGQQLLSQVTIKKQ